MLAFLFCVSNTMNAQWLALPIPPSVMSGSLGGTISLPDAILPCGNNKIVYTSYRYYSPSSGGSVFMCISKDDLSSSSISFTTNSGFGNTNLFNLNAYNDSTFSYCLIEGGFFKLYYTDNNFYTRTQMFGVASDATAISPNYVYGINQSTVVCRSNKIGSQGNCSAISNYTAKPNKLNFINDSVGFTLANFTSYTNKSTLIKSTNYGITWSPTLVDSVDGIVDYHISKHGDIYLLKKSGSVFKSTDTGASFTPLTSAPLGTYTCIHFANSTTGFIGGKNGVLLKTQDGGINWTSETSNTTQQINAIYTFNNDASYFVDANKRVYKSNQALGVTEESEGGSDLFVFPNPAIHELTIQYNSISSNEVKIEVVDISGRIVINSEFINKCKLNVSNLSDGIYIVRVVENNRIMKTKKVIISK